jgi:hypothetical protein
MPLLPLGHCTASRKSIDARSKTAQRQTERGEELIGEPPGKRNVAIET